MDGIQLALPPEVYDEIALRLADAMGKYSPERAYLDVNGAADYLGVTKSKIYTLTSERRIPFRKEGRDLIFITRELDRWVNGLPGQVAI